MRGLLLQTAVDLAIRSHEQSSLLPKNHPPGTLPADTKPQGRLRVSMLSQVMPLSPLNALPLAYFSLVKLAILATPSSIEAYASVFLEEVTKIPRPGNQYRHVHAVWGPVKQQLSFLGSALLNGGMCLLSCSLRNRRLRFVGVSAAGEERTEPGGGMRRAGRSRAHSTARRALAHRRRARPALAL